MLLFHASNLAMAHLQSTRHCGMLCTRPLVCLRIEAFPGQSDVPRHSPDLRPINKLDLSLMHFMPCRFLVESARSSGLEVIDRCNLTVLLEPGQEKLGQYLADHQVTALLA